MIDFFGNYGVGLMGYIISYVTKAESFCLKNENHSNEVLSKHPELLIYDSSCIFKVIKLFNFDTNSYNYIPCDCRILTVTVDNNTFQHFPTEYKGFY